MGRQYPISFPKNALFIVTAQHRDRAHWEPETVTLLCMECVLYSYYYALHLLCTYCFKHHVHSVTLYIYTCILLYKAAIYNYSGLHLVLYPDRFRRLHFIYDVLRNGEKWPADGWCLVYETRLHWCVPNV